MASEPSNRPEPITSRHVHDKTVALLRAHPRGRVLDAACGQGALGVRLLELGYDVTGCDIDPHQAEGAGFKVEAVNLNQPLPFGDEEFDVVACLAALHRVRNYYVTIQELTRVLKPGGTLIVSYPNFQNVRRRLRFFLLGLTTASKGFSFMNEAAADTSHYRSFVVHSQIAAGLERTGLQIEGVIGDKPLSGPLPRLIGALIRAASWLYSGKKRRQYRTDLSNHWTVLVGGAHLIVVSRKPNPSS